MFMNDPTQGDDWLLDTIDHRMNEFRQYMLSIGKPEDYANRLAMIVKMRSGTLGRRLSWPEIARFENVGECRAKRLFDKAMMYIRYFRRENGLI